MKIPDSLSFYCEPMQVRSKGGTGMMRYEFGKYKLIEAKSGWISSKIKGEKNFISNLLSNVEQQKETIKEKRSFKLVANEKDTASVNIAISTKIIYERSKQGPSNSNNRYQSGTAEYVGIIKTNDTSNNWLLSIIVSETNGLFTITENKEARLFGENRKIDLVPVQYYADGKKADDLGFTFEENGIPLAAVQYRGLVLKQDKQNFIWISSRLSNMEQLAMAAAATAIMARAHETMNASLQDSGPPKN